MSVPEDETPEEREERLNRRRAARADRKARRERGELPPRGVRASQGASGTPAPPRVPRAAPTPRTIAPAPSAPWSRPRAGRGSPTDATAMMRVSRERSARGARSAVPWIVMASLGYYHMNVSLLTDVAFDALVREVRDDWDCASEHRHACLLVAEDGSVGAPFHLRLTEYPHQVRGGLRAAIEGTWADTLSGEDWMVMLKAPFCPPRRVWSVYRYGKDTTYASYLAGLEPEVRERIVSEAEAYEAAKISS